jgi:hypothetical protein
MKQRSNQSRQILDNALSMTYEFHTIIFAQLCVSVPHMIDYKFENNQHIAVLSGFIRAAEFKALMDNLEGAMEKGPIDFVEVLRLKMMSPLTLGLDIYFFIKNRNRFKSITVVCDNPILTAISKKISPLIFSFDVMYLKEKEFNSKNNQII